MEGKALEVVISELALQSIQKVYEYGVETFSINAANVFIDELFEHIFTLSTNYLIHPECRYLPTKSQKYRNLIHGSYLVLYRISKARIEVLNIIHSSRSITSIKSSRSVKLP